jgi:hypothetical protein
MAGKRRALSRGRGGLHDVAASRGFRRARVWVWLLSALSVLVGVALHDGATRSSMTRLLWLAAVALSLAYPLKRLLGFRCPRCGHVFLATGGWPDFFGLGRILWSKRCGSCAVLLEEEPPSSDGLPESRPV